MPLDVGPSCGLELRGQDTQEGGTFEWGRGSGYCIGFIMLLLCSPCLPIPRSAIKSAKGACWGLVRGGKLSVCGLDLALRGVWFGPHSV